MLGQYLITFREVLEAALITSIVIAYLDRTGRKSLTKYIWYGVISATITSLVLGTLIWIAYGTIEKPIQALFEGIAALIAVTVLSSMIFWMSAKGKKLKSEMEKKIESIATHGATLGLVSFAFIAVFREGLETVLFLTPFLVTDMIGTIGGALLGITTSLVLAYGFFVLGKKINMRKFFYFTSIMLVLLAGGLAGYGIHELIEYSGSQSWGILGQPAYNLNLPSDNIFHHKGIIGSIFAVMFGYTTNAEWARVIIHLSYIGIALPAVIWLYQKKD